MPAASHRHWVVVTPALAAANNGNWQTAARWARMIRPVAEVSVVGAWPSADASASPATGMIALHARRSAASIAAWKQRHPHAPLVVVLTGTDLYKDLPGDPAAQHSLALADQLVVLNDLGMRSVPTAHRGKVRVCLQSATARQVLAKPPGRSLRVLAVGHLRSEKSPETLFEAVRQLHARGRRDIRVDHVGGPLDSTLADQAQALAQSVPWYRCLGDRPHGEVRRRIQAAHLLVHPSRMEGGAHVVIEAVRSGTPVVASAIDGNLGLLGADWPATFAAGDAAALCEQLVRARDDSAWLADLRQRTLALAPRFAPEREAACLLRILDETCVAAAPLPRHVSLTA
jgi:putative glycosyltransferase (TIGR04348 family)